MRSSLDRAEAALGFALRFLASLSFAALMLLVATNVAGRTLGLPEIAWVAEGVEFLFAWMIFLGAAELWRDRGHFAVDILLGALPEGAPRWALRFCVTVACLAFVLGLFWYGLRLAMDATALTPILELPMSAWYASVPVSAAVMVVSSVRDIVLLLRPGAAAALARQTFTPPQEPVH